MCGHKRADTMEKVQAGSIKLDIIPALKSFHNNKCGVPRKTEKTQQFFPLYFRGKRRNKSSKKRINLKRTRINFRIKISVRYTPPLSLFFEISFASSFFFIAEQKSLNKMYRYMRGRGRGRMTMGSICFDGSSSSTSS